MDTVQDLWDKAEKAEYWEKVAAKMAKLLMDLGAGEDVHDKAYSIVKKNFPKLYKSYE